MTKHINAETLEDLFRRGVLIVCGGLLYEPVFFAKREDGVAMINFIMADEVDDTVAVIEIVKSKEDS